MLKSLGQPSVTGQGTEKFIQSIRTASEKGLMGKLNIGLLAEKLGEVDARAVEAAKHMQQTSGSIEDFNRTVGTAIPASEKFGEALKGAFINMGAMLVAMVVIKGAMMIFDKINVTFKEQQEIVDDLKTKIADLKSEYDQLSVDPSASGEKLDYLKRQINLQERLLKIEERKLALKDMNQEMPSTAEGMTSDTAGYTYSGAGVSSLPQSQVDAYQDDLADDLDKLAAIREKIHKAYQDTPDNTKAIENLEKQESDQLDDLREWQSTLTQKQLDYADAQQRLKEYIENGTLTGSDAEKARKMIDDYQAELNKLDPLVLSVDLELGDASFIDRANSYLDKIKQANSMENLGVSEEKYRDVGYGGTLIKSSDLDAIIDKNKELNASFQEGKIKADEYFSGLSNMFGEGSKIFDAYNKLDFSKVTNQSGEWVSHTTDYLEETVTQLVSQIADCTSDVTNAFARGEMSVKDYYDSLQASGEAQLQALATTNKLTIGQDGLATATDKSSQEAQKMADSYNDLKDQLAEMDITEQLVDVNTKYADTLAELGNATEDIINSDNVKNYVAEASNAVASYMQDMRQHCEATGESFQSVVATMNETLGTSFTEAEWLSADMADTLANQFGNTLDGVILLSNGVAVTTGQVVSSAADKIGNLLTALGDTIANFDYKLTIKFEGLDIKWSDVINRTGLHIPKIDSSIDFSGSGKNVQALGKSIKDIGNSMKSEAAKKVFTNIISDFNNWRAKNNSGKTGTTSPTSPTDTSKTPTSKTPSSGSKGSKGGSGSGSKDKYTADIDKYKELSDAVENVKDKIDELNDAYDATDNIDEQISLKNVLIGLYKDEQDALEKLNKARDKEISDNVAKLRKKGFKIDYDAQTDTLVIKNREYYHYKYVNNAWTRLTDVCNTGFNKIFICKNQLYYNCYKRSYNYCYVYEKDKDTWASANLTHNSLSTYSPLVTNGDKTYFFYPYQNNSGNPTYCYMAYEQNGSWSTTKVTTISTADGGADPNQGVAYVDNGTIYLIDYNGKRFKLQGETLLYIDTLPLKPRGSSVVVYNNIHTILCGGIQNNISQLVPVKPTYRAYNYILPKGTQIIGTSSMIPLSSNLKVVNETTLQVTETGEVALLVGDTDNDRRLLIKG